MQIVVFFVMLYFLIAMFALFCGYKFGRSTIKHLLERIEQMATLKVIDEKVIWELRARRDFLLAANSTEVQKRRDAEASSLYWEVQAKMKELSHAATGSDSTSAPTGQPVPRLRKKAKSASKQ